MSSQSATSRTTETAFEKLKLTLLLVNSHNHDHLIPSNPDQLLNTPDTSPRKFRKQNHSLNVVILQLNHHKNAKQSHERKRREGRREKLVSVLSVDEF